MKLRSIFCIHFPESGIDRSQLIPIVFRPSAYFPADPVKCLLFIFFVCQILCIELKYVILFVVEYIGAALLTKILEPYGIIKFVKPEVPAADLLQLTIFIPDVRNNRHIGAISPNPGKPWEYSAHRRFCGPKIPVNLPGVFNIFSCCYLITFYMLCGDPQTVQIQSTANWNIGNFFCYRYKIVFITHFKIKLILSNRHEFILICLYGGPDADGSLTSVFAISALYIKVCFTILLDKGNILQKLRIIQISIFILKQFQREVLNVFAAHLFIAVSPLMMQCYRKLHSISRKDGIIIIRISNIQVVQILFYIEFCLVYLFGFLTIQIGNQRFYPTRTISIKIPSTVMFCHFKNIVIAFQFNTGDPEGSITSIRIRAILYIAVSLIIDPDILIHKNRSIVILKMVLIPRFCKIQICFICIQYEFFHWHLISCIKVSYNFYANHIPPILFQILVFFCKPSAINIEHIMVTIWCPESILISANARSKRRIVLCPFANCPADLITVFIFQIFGIKLYPILFLIVKYISTIVSTSQGLVLEPYPIIQTIKTVIPAADFFPLTSIILCLCYNINICIISCLTV